MVLVKSRPYDREHFLERPTSNVALVLKDTCSVSVIIVSVTRERVVLCVFK